MKNIQLAIETFIGTLEKTPSYNESQLLKTLVDVLTRFNSLLKKGIISFVITVIQSLFSDQRPDKKSNYDIHKLIKQIDYLRHQIVESYEIIETNRNLYEQFLKELSIIQQGMKEIFEAVGHDNSVLIMLTKKEIINFINVGYFWFDAFKNTTIGLKQFSDIPNTELKNVNDYLNPFFEIFDQLIEEKKSTLVIFNLDKIDLLKAVIFPTRNFLTIVKRQFTEDPKEAIILKSLINHTELLIQKFCGFTNMHGLHSNSNFRISYAYYMAREIKDYRMILASSFYQLSNQNSTHPFMQKMYELFSINQVEDNSVDKILSKINVSLPFPEEFSSWCPSLKLDDRTSTDKKESSKEELELVSRSYSIIEKSFSETRIMQDSSISFAQTANYAPLFSQSSNSASSSAISNEFITLHKRFTENQFLQGNEDEQLNEFARWIFALKEIGLCDKEQPALARLLLTKGFDFSVARESRGMYCDARDKLRVYVNTILAELQTNEEACLKQIELNVFEINYQSFLTKVKELKGSTNKSSKQINYLEALDKGEYQPKSILSFKK